MKELQIFSMMMISTIAVLNDLYSGKIHNGLIVTGLMFGFLYQLFQNGVLGLVLFAGGVLLPIVIFGFLYYLRMIGAGDIKLYCVLGGFLGPFAGWDVVVASIIMGGIVSIAILIARGSVKERLLYFADYVTCCVTEGKWKSYRAGTKEKDRFCFSVPILMGLVWYLGGTV